MLIYQLRNDIFEEIDNSLSLLIRTNDALHKKGTKYGTEQGTSASSSSSNYKTTTTTELPDEWKKIDLMPLAKINFGTAELKKYL